MASSLPDDMEEWQKAIMRHQPTKELVMGVMKGDETLVKIALANGAHPEITMPTNNGVLGCLLCVAASEGHDHLLHHLIEAGLNIEGPDNTDRTPLMEAASEGHSSTVKALLTLGANPLATDSEEEGHQQCVESLMLVTPVSNESLEAHTPMHIASYHGHIEVLEQLADAGWAITTRNSDGDTPMHDAARGGHRAVLQWLVNQGGDLCVQNKAGHTPLDVELLKFVQEGDEALMKSALASGARADIILPTIAGVSWCLVYFAAFEGHDHLLPHLLQAGLNIEGGGTIDRTPLMVAAFKGHSTTVRALLTLGANPQATSSKGWTALHFAASGGHQQCVESLALVTPVTNASLEADTPVHIASYHGYVEVLEQLADAGWPVTSMNCDGDTPLHVAARGGQQAVLLWLVDQGGELRAQNKAGHTPLDVLVKGVMEGDEAMVKSALANDTFSEINIPTLSGGSGCLMCEVASNGHDHLLPHLLQAGLSIDGAVTGDKTPLMYAASEGNSNTVKSLLALGADPLAIDSKGWTALHFAAKGGHQQCVESLMLVTPVSNASLEADTPVHIASYFGHLGVLEQLVSAGWSLTTRNSDGDTPLHSAVDGGGRAALHWLVQRGGDLSVQNNYGHRPLDMELVKGVMEGDEALVKSALANGALSEITIPMDTGASGCLVCFVASKGQDHLLPHLLQAGLNIEGAGTTDKTPLMVAAFKGHNSTVKALLSLGANYLATDSEGWTALHFAAQEGHQECVASLILVTPVTSASLEALTPVHIASYHGHLKVLEQLASNYWPLTSKNSVGDTPLHTAADGGQRAVLQWLVHQGGDLCVENKDGHTAMDVMLTKGVEEGDEGLVKFALANGARPEITNPNTATTSWCLVCLAACEGHDHLLPHLLQAGLSIEGARTTDMKPLMVAASKGHSGTVKALLSFGANPLATDCEGWTALHYAVEAGHQQCVVSLILVTPVTEVSLETCTPVHIATYHGQLEALEQLAGAGWPLTARNSDGDTLLHLAAERGHTAILQWMVHRGCDLLVQNKGGHTPLNVAVASCCHQAENWLVKNGGGSVITSESELVEEVRALRDKNKNQHNTVLSWLVGGKKIDMHNIPEHCDGHTVNEDGLTPLHAAALIGVSSYAVEALLGRGVSPHVFTPDNKTPADLAQQEGHDQVIQALHTHQCQKSTESPEHLHRQLLSTITHGDFVQEVSSLLCKSAPINPFGGKSVLRLAVSNDRPLTVSLCLANGAVLPANLLREAWQSPDVTYRVLAHLTTAYCCRLKAEQQRLAKISSAFEKGIDNLIKTIEGNTPWEAQWRWDKDNDRKALSDLLAKASAANCPVTAAFLHSAGAWAFFSPASGGSALHSALQAGHKGMAELLIKNLGASPYVPDTENRLPLHMMTKDEQQRLEQKLLKMESEKLENMELSLKADHEKEAAGTALRIQKILFEDTINFKVNFTLTDARNTLLLASRKGLLQLIHCMLQKGCILVNEILDDICGTTALHQAASHGQDGCVELLISAGANIQQADTYGQTPGHLAAMFDHKSSYELLGHRGTQDTTCRAGTTAMEVKDNFKTLVKKYCKYNRKLHSPSDRHDPKRITRNLVKAIKLPELQEKVKQVVVDLSEGEAFEIKKTILSEIGIIMNKVSVANPTYRGELRLAGSSRDGSKLYAPDEFDINLVIHEDDIKVNVSKRTKEEAHQKGLLQISVKTDKAHLQGNRFMAGLYDEIHRCLAGHILEDKRLSLVPPGLTSTQVGVALALAWQGQEYPLLLIGVDLVPVLEVPWVEHVSRPFLTPEDTTTMQISNAADGTWRCSFALIEAKVLETLSPAERQVQLMGKLVLSCLKAEPWMPQHKKRFFKWFAAREWNIAVPSGFCFKNALLRWVELRRMEDVSGGWESNRAKESGAGQEGEHSQELGTGQKGDHSQELGNRQEDDHSQELGTGQKGGHYEELGNGQEEDHSQEKDPGQQFVAGREGNPFSWVVQVFRLMCANPKESREHLATQNSSAYFGGDCEGQKSGEGAPVIVQCLEEELEKMSSFSSRARTARPWRRKAKTARPWCGKAATTRP